MKRYPIVLLILVLQLIGCDDVKQKDELENTTPPKKEEPVVVDTVVDTPKPAPKKEVKIQFTSSDKQFLKSFDDLRLGSNFETVKKEFPVIKGIRPEGGNDQLALEGLTESKGSITFFNHPGSIEFNYKNDSVYSYYISVKEKDFDKAEDLHDLISSYYTKEYGDCTQEKVEEETRFIRNCSWKADKKFMVLTYNVNTGRITWGYQGQSPF